MEDFAVTFVKLACSQFSVNVPEEGFLGKFFVCKKLLLLGIDCQQMSSFGNDGRPSSRFRTVLVIILGYWELQLSVVNRNIFMDVRGNHSNPYCISKIGIM
jgi:hypothetical protein